MIALGLDAFTSASSRSTRYKNNFVDNSSEASKAREKLNSSTHYMHSWNEVLRSSTWTDWFWSSLDQLVAARSAQILWRCLEVSWESKIIVESTWIWCNSPKSSKGLRGLEAETRRYLADSSIGVARSSSTVRATFKWVRWSETESFLASYLSIDATCLRSGMLSDCCLATSRWCWEHADWLCGGALLVFGLSELGRCETDVTPAFRNWAEIENIENISNWLNIEITWDRCSQSQQRCSSPLLVFFDPDVSIRFRSNRHSCGRRLGCQREWSGCGCCGFGSLADAIIADAIQNLFERFGNPTGHVDEMKDASLGWRGWCWQRWKLAWDWK